MKTIVHLLDQRASESGDRALYHLLGKDAAITASLTYQQTRDQATAFAAIFTELQLAGERCILMYQPGLDILPVFFGCLYAGVIAVPAFPLRKNSSAQRIRSIIADSGAQTVFTTRKVYDTVFKLFDQEASIRNMTWICTDELDTSHPGTLPARSFEDNDLAYLQYTSGSTGQPKGVMISHGNIISNLQAIDESCHHTTESRIVSWMPVFHDMGLIYGVLQPVYNGCTSYLMPPVLVMQNPFEWLYAISKYQAHYSTGPNFAYDYCNEKITTEQKKSLDLRSWIAAGCAAEPIQAATLATFAENFRECGFAPTAFAPCYGLAEATLKVTGQPMKEVMTLLHVASTALEQHKVEETEATADSQILVGCGHAASNTIIRIVDPVTHTACKPFQIGEIWVQSPSVALGLWNNPGQTETEFNAFISDTQEGPFLKTGDLGFLKDQQLFVTGRLKELIIIRGSNHYPQDIEQDIKSSHPFLKNEQSAAFSIPVNGAEELVIVQEMDLSFLAGPDEAATRKNLCNAIRNTTFQEHDIHVHDIVFIRNGSLPKTSSGKIQRLACRKAYLDNAWGQLATVSVQPTASAPIAKEQPSMDKVPPQDIRTWLLINLSEELHTAIDEFEDDEPFAAYGLDSSIAAAMTGRINDAFQIEIEPTVFWEYSTIETLSEYIEQTVNEMVMK